MSSSKAILDLYIQLRSENLSASAALEFLRGDIQELEPEERAALVKRVKRWEDSQRPAETFEPEPVSMPAEQAAPSTKPAIKSIKPLSLSKASPQGDAFPLVKPKTGSIGAAKSQEMVACPQCGRMNAAAEVLCFNCGAVMQRSMLSVETVHFDQGNVMGDTTFFSPSSTLVLVVRNSNFTFRILPQKFSHPPVIGRSDNATFMPDIDLSDQRAGELGVSRMHAEIVYDNQNNTLILSDLKSANGTFINGQRLYPHERRALRHGDEVRLGHLSLQVYFQHP